MKFKLFGINITVSYLFCAFLCIAMLFDKTGFLLPMVLAALIHEGGHLLVMKLTGNTPVEIRLIPGSVQISGHISTNKPTLLILFSGPLLNIIVFAFVYTLSIKSNEVYYTGFAIINLVYGVFNLLPLKGLDGGSILEEILTIKKGYTFANKVLNIVTVSFAALVIIIMVILELKGNANYSVYIIALYLIMSVLIKF